MDFTNIDYLLSGNERQRLAYSSLRKHAVMEKLEKFSPVLAGTIPIEIDIDSSDLDIICYCLNKEEFIESVRQSFQHEESFRIHENNVRGEESIVANFNIENFEVEIFGQNIPVNEQAGFRHMLIEYNILQEKGEEFRQEIIRLKRQGIKTEPAFTKLLGLEGDPYIELLKLNSNF